MKTKKSKQPERLHTIDETGRYSFMNVNPHDKGLAFDRFDGPNHMDNVGYESYVWETKGKKKNKKTDINKINYFSSLVIYSDGLIEFNPGPGFNKKHGDYL